MNSTQIRTSLVTTAALLAISLAAGSASAHIDPGSPAPISTLNQTNCPLERVDMQFVRCDNLTGNGAKAPTWIPTR